MSIIRVSKSFEYEMAHSLWNHDGLCCYIHGHSYKLLVTIWGNPMQEKGHPKDGMLMDFKLLKLIVHEEIVDRFDHALVLNANDSSQEMMPKHQMFERIVWVNYQPTCENMILDFAERIKQRLPANVKLHCLRLHETSNSFAEWYADDNE